MKSTLRFLLASFLLAATCVPPCSAALSEVQMQAAYVFNFIKFVEWPADTVKAGDKIRVCMIGDDGLHASLSAFNGRKAGEYELQIMPQSLDSDDLSACHVLYIDEREQRRVVSILKSLGDAPVLTVSDISGFAERGGSIGLLYRDNRMLFEVNLAATRKARLHLSGQMLNLAANIFGR